MDKNFFQKLLERETLIPIIQMIIGSILFGLGKISSETWTAINLGSTAIASGGLVARKIWGTYDTQPIQDKESPK